jgi:hypothetical protein
MCVAAAAKVAADVVAIVPEGKDLCLLRTTTMQSTTLKFPLNLSLSPIIANMFVGRSRYCCIDWETYTPVFFDHATPEHPDGGPGSGGCPGVYLLSSTHHCRLHVANHFLHFTWIISSAHLYWTE